MDKNAKIYIAGHRGLVGSAIYRHLKNLGFNNLLTRSHTKLDLKDEKKTFAFFEQEKPEYVFLAAALVGGIKATKDHPARYFYDNLKIYQNVIEAARISRVKKLLFLGSGCIYPEKSNLPIKEAALMNGLLEPAVEPYAMAKLAGVKMCQYYRREYGCDFITAIPCAVYGLFDNFNPETSHILPGMMHRFLNAKINQEEKTTLWGTGKARREFVFSDDLAEALVLIMQGYSDIEPINIAPQEDIEINAIAKTIKEVVGFEGEIENDLSKPIGTLRKLLSNEKITRLGWQPKTGFKEGLTKVYQWYLSQMEA